MLKLRSTGVMGKWKRDLRSRRIQSVNNKQMMQVTIGHVKIILITFLISLIAILLVFLCEIKMRVRRT